MTTILDWLTGTLEMTRWQWMLVFVAADALLHLVIRPSRIWFEHRFLRWQIERTRKRTAS